MRVAVQQGCRRGHLYNLGGGAGEVPGQDVGLQAAQQHGGLVVGLEAREDVLPQRRRPPRQDAQLHRHLRRRLQLHPHPHPLPFVGVPLSTESDIP